MNFSHLQQLFPGRSGDLFLWLDFTFKSEKTQFLLTEYKIYPDCKLFDDDNSECIDTMSDNLQFDVMKPFCGSLTRQRLSSILL